MDLQNITIEEKENLLHNLSLGVLNPKIDGEYIVANWNGTYQQQQGSYINILNCPVVQVHQSEIGKDLKNAKYKKGEWVNFEVLDLDWYTKGEDKF